MRQKCGTEKRPAEAVIKDICRAHPQTVWGGGKDPLWAAAFTSERWPASDRNRGQLRPECLAGFELECAAASSESAVLVRSAGTGTAAPDPR